MSHKTLHSIKNQTIIMITTTIINIINKSLSYIMSVFFSKCYYYTSLIKPYKQYKLINNVATQFDVIMGPTLPHIY